MLKISGLQTELNANKSKNQDLEYQVSQLKQLEKAFSDMDSKHKSQLIENDKLSQLLKSS